MDDRAAAVGSLLRGAVLALPTDVAMAIFAAGAVVVFLAAARRVPLNSAFTRGRQARGHGEDATAETRRPPLRLGFPIRPAKGTRRA